MNLHFDEDLVEAAVFLCTSGRRKGTALAQIARFNREREKLYAILEPDDRNSAFFKLHLAWFREWGLEDLLTAPLGEFPLFASHLRLLAFRKAQGRKDEGAELYVNEAGERHGVVAIGPELFCVEARLASFLRHELTHLHDMIDPVFDYSPNLGVSGPSMSQHRLARERYRLLWDVTIDGRLTQARKPTIATQQSRWAEFTAAFAFWSETEQQRVFNELWTSPTPTHQALERWVCDPRQLQASSGPRPGGHCPLCGFPTFAWTPAAALPASDLHAIRSEFPHWNLEQGICARCASMYHVNGLRRHATV